MSAIPLKSSGATVLLIVITASITVGWVAWIRSRPADIVLLVDGKRLDFGQKWTQDDLRVTLPLRNNSAERYVIDRFNASCACTSISPSTLEIPPGETRELYLTIDLRPDDAEAGISEHWDFELSVIAFVSVPERAVREMQVSGRVRTAFKRIPKSVDLGDVLTEQRQSASTQVQLTSYLSLNRVECRSSASGCRVTCESTADGRSHLLTLTLDPAFPFGEFDFPVYVAAVTKGGEVIPPVRVDVRGTRVPDPIVAPTSVAIGELLLGDSRSETLLVQSRTGQEITDVRLSILTEYGTPVEQDAEVAVHRVPYPGAGIAFQVDVTPAKLGRLSRTLRLAVDQGSRRTLLAIPVSAYASRGLEP